ncbi:MAG: carbohydrate kinase family protein [Candidatus Aenigmatarchaeota archaeon]
MKASIAGSIVTDITIYPAREFKLFKDFLAFPFDYKIQIDKISLDVGGSGFNIAKVLSFLKNKVEFFGKVGNDSYGEKILKAMEENKVSTKNVKVVDGMSGFSLIFLFRGEKTIITYRGANNLLSEKDIDEKTIKNSDCFIFTSMISNQNIKFLRKATEIARENDVKIVCNPSIAMVDYQKNSLLELMKKSDFVIMNKKEAMKLTKANNPIKAAKKLKKVSNSTVIVTLGKKGSLLFEEKIKIFKSFKVKVVDTTGAGDSFTAAFIHSFFKTKELDYSMKFANAYAALKISKGKEFIPSEKEVVEFIGEKDV